MIERIALPRDLELGCRRITLRLMSRSDAEDVLVFARGVDPHDLLFLQRDIRNPRVVSAWADQIEQGQIVSILALWNGNIVGCSAVVSDRLSWSSHVAEIRVVVSAHLRRTGLGRLLAQESLLIAESGDAAKAVARTTIDQASALAVFQDMGFRPEALLRDHVRDADGRLHDIVILALDLARQESRHLNFGVDAVA